MIAKIKYIIMYKNQPFKLNVIPCGKIDGKTIKQ